MHKNFVLEIPSIKQFTKFDIGLADDIPNVPGIYFLFDRHNTLLYIGKSVRLKERVNSHVTNNSYDNTGLWGGGCMVPDNSVEYIKIYPCNEEDLLFIEQFYIWKYKPLFNQTEQRYRKKISREEKHHLYNCFIATKAYEERAKDTHGKIQLQEG